MKIDSPNYYSYEHITIATDRFDSGDREPGWIRIFIIEQN